MSDVPPSDSVSDIFASLPPSQPPTPPAPPAVFLFNLANEPALHGDLSHYGHQNFVVTQSGRVLGVTVLRLMLVFVLIVVIASIVGLIQQVYFQNSGVETTATILSRRTVSTRRTNSYYVTLRYRDRQEHLHQSEQAVDYSTYASVSSTTPVVYQPDNPDNVTVGGRGMISLSGGICYVACCIPLLVLLSPFLLLRWFITFNKRNRLRREGQLISGVVVDTSWTATPSVVREVHPMTIFVHYKFTAPDGEQLTGQGFAMRPEGFVEAPAPNTPVAVLFVNNRFYEAL